MNGFEEHDYGSADSVRWFVGILREQGYPAIAVGPMFGLGWDELARLAAGDDTAWDDQPAEVRACGGEIVRRTLAEAERRFGARQPVDATGLGPPEAGCAPAEPAAVGAAQTDRGGRAGPPPSLARRLLAELLRTDTPRDRIAAAISLSPEDLARLEAGEEAVWTGKPLADRLRALEQVRPFLFALDPDAPMPAPRDRNGPRPGWPRVVVEFRKPDGQGPDPEDNSPDPGDGGTR